jgi:hypothetical protein
MDFVSFGPCCLGAELLKALELRSCSYGFDWCRSGSYEHKDFLRLGAKAFFHRNVVNPALRLRQSSSPHSSPTKTSEVVQIKPIYGYPYTYNPHRALNSKADLDYLARCFDRLDDRLWHAPAKPITIILSDYTNKPGYTHFKTPHVSARYLLAAFQLYRSSTPKIRLVRYTVVQEVLQHTVALEEAPYGDLLHVLIPEQIDNNVNLRRQYYRRLYPLFV